MDRLYIAATSQHVGKTTSTLGLMAAIKERGINVGYCKPVGQQFVDLGVK
ncbi:MAG: dethiobiotin synthase [Bacteroidota bacterium]